MKRNEQAVHVKQRERVHKPVVGREPPMVVQCSGVAPKRIVGEGGTLGLPRGAGGVEDGGEIVVGSVGWLVEVIGGVRPVGQGASAVAVESQPCWIGGERRVDDDDGWFSVFEEVAHLVDGERWVERDMDRAGP